MTNKTITTRLVLSHDHLVQAVSDYLSNNQLFWPLPEEAEIVDIDFGLPLDDDGERYTLEMTYEMLGEEDVS